MKKDLVQEHGLMDVYAADYHNELDWESGGPLNGVQHLSRHASPWSDLEHLRVIGQDVGQVFLVIEANLMLLAFWYVSCVRNACRLSDKEVNLEWDLSPAHEHIDGLEWLIMT